MGGAVKGADGWLWAVYARRGARWADADAEPGGKFVQAREHARDWESGWCLKRGRCCDAKLSSLCTCVIAGSKPICAAEVLAPWRCDRR